MTGSFPPPTVALNDLHLAGARALLGEDAVNALPSPQSQATQHLQGVIDGLCDLSSLDPLTGCANRRHFDAVLERELDRVSRSGDTALLLMVDVDHFKRINDLYGHHIGDVVLQQIAHSMSECIRQMDTLARYGGEEFAIVLPACQPAYGRAIAERLRQSVESLVIPVPGQPAIRVTISMGGAYALEWVRSTRQLWVQRADQRLYISKSEGRNRITIEEQPDSTVSAEEKSLLFANDYSTSDTWADDWSAALVAPIEPTDGVN